MDLRGIHRVVADGCGNRRVVVGACKENAMADVTFVTPLWEPGVQHAKIDSWTCGEPADPLGVLSPNGTSQCKPMSTGSGDMVNDWKATFPDGGKG